MELKDLVLTIEQSKHLQELGLDMSDAGMCCVDDVNGNYFPTNKDMFLHAAFIPTYTLQEVLDKLPKMIIIEDADYSYDLKMFYESDADSYVMYYEAYKFGILEYLGAISNNSLKECAYQMLSKLLEIGFLK